MLRDLDSVEDIIRSAEQAIQFVGGVEFEVFEQDAKLHSAVLYNLIIIGEATKRLSAGFRDSNPQIDWKKMAGMRDILIHGYHRTNNEIVWKTVRYDLPPVVPLLKSLLANASEE